MKILCTFPGRYGDLLWALPTLRALSRRTGEPIDLLIAGEFEGIVPLIQRQPYIRNVAADPTWALGEVQTPPPETSRFRDIAYDHVIHLAYRGWPKRPLPFETLDNYNTQQRLGPLGVLADGALDLQTPWIQVDGPFPPTELAIGFTEAWFELKLGLMACLDTKLLPPYLLLTPPGSRWTQEGRRLRLAIQESGDWVQNAGILRNADLFLGDCSALHVLAVAVGTPVVAMEPMEARWNPIFWPLSKTGPQVTLVTGNDGLPTWDARHVREALELKLAR